MGVKTMRKVFIPCSALAEFLWFGSITLLKATVPLGKISFAATYFCMSFRLSESLSRVLVPRYGLGALHESRLSSLNSACVLPSHLSLSASQWTSLNVLSLLLGLDCCQNITA